MILEAKCPRPGRERRALARACRQRGSVEEVGLTEPGGRDLFPLWRPEDVVCLGEDFNGVFDLLVGFRR